MMRQYSEPWRLLYDSAMVGARNMALDDAMLRFVAQKSQPPTLRFYAWNPPCLSLGYGQRVSIVDWERVERLGWSVCRRPTGGGAILHMDELTYSVALPDDHPFAKDGIIECYRRISEGLLSGLRKLDIEASAEPLNGHSQAAVICFETPSHYEIAVGKRKLVGSAQARKNRGVLQHGTLPLFGNLARICDGLIYENESEREEAKRRVSLHAVTLEIAAGGKVISWQEAAQVMAEGFQQALGISLVQSPWSEEELCCAEELHNKIYSQREWVYKR